MYTINQVLNGWEVQKNGVPIETFRLQYFETHEDCEAYLEAIEYVRKEAGYGTYFDFTAITVKNHISRR